MVIKTILVNKSRLIELVQKSDKTGYSGDSYYVVINPQKQKGLELPSVIVADTAYIKEDGDVIIPIGNFVAKDYEHNYGAVVKNLLYIVIDENCIYYNVVYKDKKYIEELLLQELETDNSDNAPVSEPAVKRIILDKDEVVQKLILSEEDYKGERSYHIFFKDNITSKEDIKGEIVSKEMIIGNDNSYYFPIESLLNREKVEEHYNNEFPLQYGTNYSFIIGSNLNTSIELLGKRYDVVYDEEIPF